ncbi:MAG: ABC transporter ATP-binding protein [Chloroflexota bacterium]|nr:ABC transporter ATP-binding protein [Chloroflexota bacterium]
MTAPLHKVAEIDLTPAQMRAVARIAVEEVSKRFALRGERLDVLCDVTICALPGEFVSIIGPSGSGKSTLLNILAGLEPPSAGRVLIDNHDVTGRLDLTGYMPQRDLLLPWKTVLDNTALGIRMRGMSIRQARREALRQFPRFGLEGFEEEYPVTLSGGMRQRAALLRTILTNREILLLDEPFGALDALTRADMQAFLLDVWSTYDRTIIFVTHDVDEAIYLSDRIYVLSPRPGSVAAEYRVGLPRPRRYDEIVTSGPFINLKRKLLDSLRGVADA